MSESKTKLDTPHVRVTYADGTAIDVQTENPDMVFWDFERARRKWPTFQDAPFLWISYLAYSKLKRSSELANPTLTFEQWLPTTSAVTNLNGDAESPDVEQAGPTQPGHEPD